MYDITQNVPLKSYTQEERLAVVKASNQMLAEALGRMRERGCEADKIDAMEMAIKDNLDYAKNSLFANEDDIENARYHGASISSIKSYEDRLKRKGLTDEQLRRKDLATTGVTATGNSPEAEKQKEEPVRKRRTRKKKEEPKDVPETYIEEAIQETPSTKSVTEEEKKAEKLASPVRKQEKQKDAYGIEQFNLDDIPDYVQYDIIPLPSRGQCYPHKKSSLPVAYLTASDENLIASPNMYRDGKLLDVILRRKILDKSVNVDELCSGDRDAIILWLRATSYGDDFPISAVDQGTGKTYETTVKLSSLQYKNLELEGDEDGLLTYSAGKDTIKFRYPSKADEDRLKERLSMQMSNYDRYTAMTSLEQFKMDVRRLSVSEEDRALLNEDISELQDIVLDVPDKPGDEVPETITEQMKLYTIAVNGRTDREYVEGFIDNMRSGEALKYRNFINENFPGVDFRVTINKPESDGGGSFDTFLRLDDNVFLNF